MLRIVDNSFSIDDITENDIFIGTIGYEQRSVYLLEKVLQKLSTQRMRVFYCDSDSCDKFDLLNAEYNTPNVFIKVEYDDGVLVTQNIKSFINSFADDTAIVYIDYSSMPRNWYCRFPQELQNICNRVNYLYVCGEYSDNYELYPCAGIHEYLMIGNPSLRTDGKRLHVFGLGYDVTRTEALISILDPDLYYVCAASTSNDKNIINNVKSINNQIIAGSSVQLSFDLCNYSQLVSKLCEIANEYIHLGDVVLIPDGPKPLVMAMSLVPMLLEKKGVSCILVSRNDKYYKPVDVQARDIVLSFSIINSE